MKSALVLALCGCLASGCSISMPMMGWASLDDEPPAALTTGSIAPRVAAQAPHAMVISPKAQAGALGAQAGTLAKPAPGLPQDLGPEELRRAHGALALALDPQGNGKLVSWDNPQSSMKGHITPLGSPFLKSDEICRDFLAATTLQTGPVTQKGTACRPSGGEWTIQAIVTVKAT